MVDGSVYAMHAVTPRPPSRGRRDPLALMLGAGERWELITICLAIATSLHAAMLLFAIVTGLLKDLHLAVDDNRARLHDFFWRQYEVEVVKPKEDKPEPPPPPEPEAPPPPPAPAPKAAPKPVEDDPYKNVAPKPSEASKVLTKEPKADEPVDMGAFTITSGQGSALGGKQAGDGTGNRVVTNDKASLLGTPGGRGSSTAPVQAAPGPDLSRAIGLAGSSSWNCPFPAEADADQIDQAVVGVQVTVRPDGSASSVSVVSDPGHGFGRAAKGCALSRRYQPALDRAGTPILSSSLINVRFRR